MYLAVSTNVADVSPLMEAELARLDELRAEGVLLGAWVKADHSGAALVLDCADDESVDAILATFPTSAAGATTFVLTKVADLDAVRS